MEINNSKNMINSLYL